MTKVALYILVSISILLTAYKTYHDEGREILGLLLYFLLIAQMIYTPEAFDKKIRELTATFLVCMGLFGICMYALGFAFFDQNLDLLLAVNSLLLGLLLKSHLKE